MSDILKEHIERKKRIIEHNRVRDKGISKLVRECREGTQEDIDECSKMFSEYTKIYLEKYKKEYQECDCCRSTTQPNEFSVDSQGFFHASYEADHPNDCIDYPPVRIDKLLTPGEPNE